MSDTNFIREIEEEVRRDRLLKIWERYGVYIIAAIVLVVLAVAGWRGWQWHQARENAKAGTRFEQAIALSNSGKAADSEQEFAGIVKDAPSGYRVLARFALAGTVAKKDPAAGVKAFDEIAADSSTGPVLRDLAKIRAAYLLVDTASPAEISARVEPLMGTGMPFRNSAKEALALSYFRAGDKAKARALFGEILADPAVTPALQNRTQIMLALTADAAGAVKPNSPTQ